MNKPVIEINHIGKSYLIGHENKAAAGTMTFRDSIAGIIKKPIEIFTGHKLKKEKFSALKDINLNIDQGDVVGIIGRNGSGKSTLLKVLSRITEPSKGEIIMRGRSASLLEVGTGFHPELTGRENIFFNGSILGMKKKEIEAKFDEIINFSGVEKFLDTPVKFYSSGMYVRLAFAVAAHLEPDILIVDEVLAVGDAEFQRKSLGKMQDVTRQDGRTVLFVSHNMDSVAAICNKCLWLNKGEIQAFGDTEKVIRQYSESAAFHDDTPLKERKDRQGTGRVVFTSAKLDESQLINKKELSIHLSIDNKTKETFEDAKISTDIYDQLGNHLSNLTNFIANQRIIITPGKSDLSLTITNINLIPGAYSFNLFLASDKFNAEILDWVENANTFTIPDYDFYGVGHPPSIKGRVVYLDYQYEQ